MEVQLTQRTSKYIPRFPNRIREYRIKAGLSQRQLGVALGHGRNVVSAWERGLSLPPVPKLMQMAKVLDTLAEALYRDYYSPLRREVGDDLVKKA